VAQNLRASADDHVVEKCRVPLTVFLAGSTERHTLIERDVLTHNGSLADLPSGRDFDTGEKPRDLRQPARQQQETVVPQPVVHAIKPDRMQAGVAEINL